VVAPNTTHTVGTRSAVSWLRSRAIAPPGGGPAGAAAPVDSTRLINGSRFTAAMRAARRIFSTV
jgi:hypothetical protein